MTKWGAADMPDVTGRRVVITGGNSGIGLETARILAAHGADVILACRSDEVVVEVGEMATTAAIADIGATATGSVSSVEIDLASQASVKAAADAIGAQLDGLDLLINNAAVMWQPRRVTEDGYELHMAVNHLGHFTLTALLLPLLVSAPQARVVSVASFAHLTADFDPTDLFYERRRYNPRKAYASSKLATLLFMRELARRFSGAGSSTIAVGAHPGVASSHLFANAFPNPRISAAFDRLASASAQDCVKGALPTLYAATMPDVDNGDFYGPKGFAGLWGHPGPSRSSKASKDPDYAAQLWAWSEDVTGIRFDPAVIS